MIETQRDAFDPPPAPGTRAADIERISEILAENERLRAALKICIEAHETGRHEPAATAYEHAKNTLDEMSDSAPEKRQCANCDWSGTENDLTEGASTSGFKGYGCPECGDETYDPTLDDMSVSEGKE